MKNNNEDAGVRSDYFDSVRESLRYWPYTIHQIDDTLDAGLIEGRGKQLLYRAIHSQDLVVFAGSGLSMSYGRLTWRDWEKEQRRTAEETAKCFLELADTALDWIDLLRIAVDPFTDNPDKRPDDARHQVTSELEKAWTEIHKRGSTGTGLLDQKHRHNIWRWLQGRSRAISAAKRQIERLYDTFQLTQKEGGRFPGGEELPVKFEIAQQLHNELQRYIGLFLPKPDDNGRVQLVSSWPGALMIKRDEAPVEAFRALARTRWKLREIHPAFRTQFGFRKAYFKELQKLEALTSQPEARMDFETQAKALLVDECPHALMLLRKGLLKGLPLADQSRETRRRLRGFENKLGIFSHGNQRRDIKGIREYPERYRVLTPFKFDNLFKLFVAPKEEDVRGPGWPSFWREANKWLEPYTTKNQGDRCYLTPSSRFLVCVALALSPDPFEALGIEKDTGAVSESEFFSPPSLKDFQSRRAILAYRYDPLPKIHRDFKVNRFITTNYDFEIERYFQDHGYREFTGARQTTSRQDTDRLHENPENFRTNNSGKVLRDLTFHPERAAELTAFAVEEETHGVSVYHLHGRATDQDGLVITERDYMNLYLTEDRNRPTTDEAIQVAFSGSPLLFLGLGMEETDLLRPLRQFISNRDRTIGYTSIALLPAEDELAARTKFSASLYLRYGVHTVFYGGGQLTYLNQKKKIKDNEAQEDQQFGIDWLNRILALIRAMKGELDLWESDGTQLIVRQSHEIFAGLDKKVKELGTDLPLGEGGADYKADYSALRVILDAKQSLGAGSVAADVVDGVLKLRTCDFVPLRPGVNRESPHNASEKMKVSGEDYLGFQTELLNELLRMVLDLPNTMRGEGGGLLEEEQRKKTTAPIRLALDGLYGAFLTGCLNAALTGIAREQKVWWKKWQRPPYLRQAVPQLLDEPKHVREREEKADQEPVDDDSYAPEAKYHYPIELGACFVRHKLDNVITVLDEPDEKQQAEADFYELDKAGTTRLGDSFCTRVRSFDTFIAAVYSTFEHRRSEPTLLGGLFKHKDISSRSSQRQLITVAARRGMGKGTFMSALISKLGMRAYQRACWPEGSVFFAGSIFINFGFSTEVASAYDMIGSAATSIIAAMDWERHYQQQGAQKEPIGSKAYQKQAEVHQERTLQKIDKEIDRLSRMAALESVFDRLAKSAAKFRAKDKRGRQPRVLLNLCAIDLLFDASGEPKNGEVQEFIELLFSEELRGCPIDIIFLADDTRLGKPWRKKAGKAPQRRYRLDRKGLPLLANEQITRALRASNIEVEESIEERDARLAGKTPIGFAPSEKEPHFIHFTRPVNPIWLKIDNFPVLATALYLSSPPGDKSDCPAEKFEQLHETFSKAVTEGRATSDREMTEIWQQVTLPTAVELAEKRGLVAEEVKAKLDAEICEHASIVRRARDPSKTEGFTDIKVALRYRLQPGERDTNQWRDTRRGLGNSRFSLTILLAAAENTIIHDVVPMDGARKAEALILDTVTSVRNVGEEKRDQMVLERVLEVYQGLHRIGDPDLDHELHTLILRHLAVIGTPVGSAVLVRLTEFRRYFKRIGIELEVSRRRFLVRAITTMAYRGLIFRLDPHPWQVSNDKEEAWPSEQEYRFSLHRVVQSYALRHLGVGPGEAALSNSFAPTLYSAMPSSGPTLSRASYRFLRTLMIGLSQYPDIPSNDATSEPWLFTTHNKTTRAQAVRAALTTARSSFSVAVISRLAEHKPIGSGVQDRGYFETYRVRLRWIIRIAWEMFADDEQAKQRLHALYRDEIVWLYNELGVISLTQGSLSDALGYLRQAAEENEKIEGLSRTSPVFNHIDLNHAIVQLERGNFNSARSRLRRVERANANRSQKLYHLARGYQVLLDHLEGRREGMQKRFEEVAGYFQEKSEDRAAAVFLMHFARFLAEQDNKEAMRLIRRARDLAETAGHEDVRHHIELAMLRIKVCRPSKVGLSADEQKTVHRVEHFGRRMAAWNLQVDALMFRARLLLRQNETATAGRLLTRAMAIAKRHSQVLRLNSCMTIYADALHERGDLRGAALMAQRSLDLAKDVGYSLETARAQRILAKCAERIGT